MNRLTHERCNGIMIENWSKGKKDDQINALTAYEDIGITPEEAFKLYEIFGITPDQIMELKERDTPKEPEQFDGHWYKCPSCGKYVGGLKGNFCHMCGQRLKRRED